MTLALVHVFCFCAPRGVRLKGEREPHLRLTLDSGPDLSPNPLIHLEGS